MSDTGLPASYVTDTAASDPEHQAVLQNVAAAGVSTTDKMQADYFGFAHQDKIFLPDGVTYLLVKKLNEGDRKKYNKAIAKAIRIQKGSGDAFLGMQTGEERSALLNAAIVGWNFVRNGDEVPWSSKLLDQWLEGADPVIVDYVYKEVTKLNPWLLGEMTVEDIQKEIDSLIEMRDLKKAEEEGKASS